MLLRKRYKRIGVSYNDLIKQHLEILKNLQYESGLFAASKKGSTTGYDKPWLRDNFYECLAFDVLKDYQIVKKTYRAILRIFEKHEHKIDYAIAAKPQYRHQYIHARHHPVTFDEFWEDWGNKQNDSIGAILFEIGRLYKKGVKVLETEKDFEIMQKLVDYLSTLEYWHDEDSGMWEEDEEVHASSIGACVAGLLAVSGIPQIIVAPELIRHGFGALNRILPRESKRKFVDLALLSLIYPYNIVTREQALEILDNVEYHLVKNRGVIRYKGDRYYNKNPDGYSEEAEWTMGFSFLAIIYKQLADRELKEYGRTKSYLVYKTKYLGYERLALKTVNEKGEIPEAYFSNSLKYNENSPLGWAESLFVVAIYQINKKHIFSLKRKRVVKVGVKN